MADRALRMGDRVWGAGYGEEGAGIQATGNTNRDMDTGETVNTNSAEATLHGRP